MASPTSTLRPSLRHDACFPRRLGGHGNVDVEDRLPAQVLNRSFEAPDRQHISLERKVG